MRSCLTRRMRFDGSDSGRPDHVSAAGYILSQEFSGENIEGCGQSGGKLSDAFSTSKPAHTPRRPCTCCWSPPATPWDIKDYFRVVCRRTVAKDRSLTIDGLLYEAPVALVGKRIDLLYHKDSPKRVEARFNNQSYGFLRPVDLAVNCRVKRDRNTLIQSTSNTAPKGGKIW